MATWSRPVVLSDEGSKLGKAYGSEAIDDWHGVLIIDSTGKARWIASGSKPLMNLRRVLVAIDNLRLAREPLESHEISE